MTWKAYIIYISFSLPHCENVWQRRNNWIHKNDTLLDPSVSLRCELFMLPTNVTSQLIPPYCHTLQYHFCFSYFAAILQTSQDDVKISSPLKPRSSVFNPHNEVCRLLRYLMEKCANKHCRSWPRVVSRCTASGNTAQCLITSLEEPAHTELVPAHTDRCLVHMEKTVILYTHTLTYSHTCTYCLQY